MYLVTGNINSKLMWRVIKSKCFILKRHRQREHVKNYFIYTIIVRMDMLPSIIIQKLLLLKFRNKKFYQN